MNERFKGLVQSIGSCTACSDLPFGINPVLQLSPAPKILVIGQAPGKKVHNAGIPWNENTGEPMVYRRGAAGTSA